MDHSLLFAMDKFHTGFTWLHKMNVPYKDHFQVAYVETP